MSVKNAALLLPIQRLYMGIRNCVQVQITNTTSAGSFMYTEWSELDSLDVLPDQEKTMVVISQSFWKAV